MVELIPSRIPIPAAAPEDVRIGRVLSRRLESAESARVVLVGFPVDSGVVRNGGRPGAAGGPDALRHSFFRMTPDPRRFDPFVRVLEETADLGDITGDEQTTMEEMQEALGKVIAPYLKRGVIVIVLGGGHETAYGHFLGYVNAGRNVNIINWDAHLDVRPLLDGQGHSGSMFRQALEHPSGMCSRYFAVGVNPQATAKAHWDYLGTRKDGIWFQPEVDLALAGRVYSNSPGDILVTMDLDVLGHECAPGVSSPSPCGIPLPVLLEGARQAGACTRVRSFDLVELNPTQDMGDVTSRVAAFTLWNFVLGLCDRFKSSLT